jgi:large subunit ribosomal protein L18
MDKTKEKTRRRRKRHMHIRRTVEGTPERPRLCVSRSNKNISAQVIDDYSGHTLASASTLDPDLRDQVPNGGTVDAATRVGEALGQKCLQNGITKVVFDRGGHKFHGRVKALADAVRKQFQEGDAPGF